jgi:ATP-dependent RNA helicase DeaD
MASDSLTDPLEAAPAPDTQTDADSAASTDIPSTPASPISASTPPC